MSKCLSCETEHTKFSFALLFVFLTISTFSLIGKSFTLKTFKYDFEILEMIAN